MTQMKYNLNGKTYCVSGVFSSNMVIQRDHPIRVWGFSNIPGDIITVDFMNEKKAARVTKDGKWEVIFSARAFTSELQQMKVSSQSDLAITEFDNILIGDVWIINGQSNATLPLSTTIRAYPDYKSQITGADLIRVYGQYYWDLNNDNMMSPQYDVIKSSYAWSVCDWNGVSEFSALGYHFAKVLSENINIPIGVIMTGRGGCDLYHLMSTKRALELGYDVLGKCDIGPAGGVYNAFMKPFTKMAISGMLFYQGESNGATYKTYANELKILVEDLRKEFKSKFPLYIVQLASVPEDLRNDFPNIPQIRSQQLDALQNISDAYITVCQDIGWKEGKEPDVLHPDDKKTLGERLACIALAQEYGISSIEYESSPLPYKLTWEKDYLFINFKYVGDGLKTAKGTSDKLVGFQILKNNQLCETEAQIVESDIVRVAIDSKTEAVCYAMKYMAPIMDANLCNSSELPSPTFKYLR